MSGTVLLLGFASLPEILAVEAAAKVAGAGVRAVGPGDWDVPLGELAEGKSAPAGAPSWVPPGKALVFCGLKGGAPDGLLAALRSAGVTGHRAVLTPRNRSWTPARLLAELDRERAALEGGNRF